MEAPIAWGYTRPTVRATMGCNPERGSKSPKSALGSDRGLKLALVKPESLVGERHQGSWMYEIHAPLVKINEQERLGFDHPATMESFAE